jgi:hypothetical protein
MTDEIEEEARRLTELFDDQPQALISFLSGQLSVLKSQAQVLMGLSGLVITVTGFSGHNMVRGGPWPTAAMVLGIGFVLLAVLVTLRVMTRLRWVSQDLGDDLVQTTAIVLRRRNSQQRALLHGGTFVAIGLGSYLISVVLAALSIGSGMGPPP